MQCKACGTENADSATICSSCGERLGGSAGAQVWPKNASRLTEFKPSDEEKEALERVRDQLNGVISAIEETGDVAPVSAAKSADAATPVEPAAELAAEQAEEPAAEPLAEHSEEPATDIQEPIEAAVVQPEEPASEQDEAPQVEEASESVEELQSAEPSEATEAAAADAPKKTNRLIIGIIAAAIVVAAIIGIVWFVGQQSGGSSPTDVKSYAGQWVLVEGDDPSLSRSNIADLKTRGLECTLVLKDDGTGTLVLFSSPDMPVEWSIDQETKKATGTIEESSTFDLQLTDNGVALVDKTGKSMYFERK